MDSDVTLWAILAILLLVLGGGLLSLQTFSLVTRLRALIEESQAQQAERFKAEERRTDSDRAEILERLDRLEMLWRASDETARVGLEKAHVLEASARRIEALLAVPIVERLRVERIGGQSVKLMDGQLDFGVDVLRAAGLAHAHRGWEPSEDGLPPYSMFTPGEKTGQTIFSTHAFAINCAVLADLINLHGQTRYEATLDTLVSDIIRHSDRASVGGRRIRLDYDHSVFETTIPAGWASASAQAEAALGVLQLSQAKAMPEPYHLLARELVAPLIAGDEHLVRRDSGGYLWLEDMPPIDGQPLQSLRGHLLGTLAVYRYIQCTDDRAAEPILRACLATAARYLPELRRPGDTPIFALAHRDTGAPSETSLHALVVGLGLISRHPIFASVAMALHSDAPPSS